MTWENIIKRKKEYSEAQRMLTEFFNIPLSELNNLNIPPNLTAVLRLDSNLETIDEDKFTLLMMLSEEGRYQEVVDVLSNFLSAARAERRKIYQQTSPKAIEWRRKYNESRRKK